MAQNRLKWIRGNRLKLIIPMQRVDFTDHGKMTEDYFPPEGTEISVELQGVYRKYAFVPEVDENKLIIEDNGTLNVGDYAVVITATEPDGTRRRSRWNNIVSIYDDNSPVVAEFDDFPDYAEGQVIEGSVFFFTGGEGGLQVQSDWDESDPENPAYIKHKPTIPAAQVQADWTEADIDSKAYIKNKPTNLVEDESYVHTDNNYTDEEKEKLADLENYDDSGIRQEIDDKVDKVDGKGLSTNDYTDEDKQKVNSALQSETDPTVPQWAKQSQKPTYTAQEVGALPNSTKYGSTIDLAMDSATYVLTLSLKDQDGTVLNTKTVDLPIESVVVNGRYDAVNKKIVLTLQSGSTIDVPVGDLIAGLQTEITSVNMLDADLVDDTNSAHKFVTAQEKTTWNNKSDFSGSYNDLSDKPVIPTVPTNVSAFTNDAGYLTQHQDIGNKQDKLTVSSGAHSGAWMSNAGNYYIITNEVDTLVVVLYQNRQATGLQEIVWNFTTGSTPNVTFNAGSGGNIYVADGFEIEASSTYEVNALWNGTNWYIAGIKLINTASV